MGALRRFALRAAFLRGRDFRGLGRGGHFAAARGGPAGLIHLAAASQRQGIGGNIFGDDRTGADVGAIADANRRDQGAIAADEDAAADRGRVLVHAVVIAGDGAGADVGAARRRARRPGR